MIRITLALTGALAALAFSAATAHAEPASAWWPDYPTQLDEIFNAADGGSNPTFSWDTFDQDFSVFNHPDETFMGAGTIDSGPYFGLGYFGEGNYNITVVEDISGNVPIGEQYNNFWINLYSAELPTSPFLPNFGHWGEVYNDIGVTPEAFLVTPFGNIDFPTAFVEAVGPTFFEPWASLGL